MASASTIKRKVKTNTNMSRNQNLAGTRVKQGQYTVAYDENGYATGAVKDNGASATHAAPLAGNGTNNPQVVQTTNDWSNQTVNDQGYRDGVDYSLAIRNATSDAEIQQLQAERQNKINAVYGGNDPYKNVNTAAKYGQSWNPQTTNLAETQKYAAVQQNVNAARDEAYNAARQGDWDAVGTAVNKIAAAEGSNADGQYSMKNANEYFRQLANHFGYNAQDYYNKKAEAALGGNSAADLPTVPGGGGWGAAVRPGGISGYLEPWFQQAQQQQSNQIDYATQQAMVELQRAKEDADAWYQAQRDQIAVSEAKAKDNQALYAQARGDRGGIGAAQYDAIMAAAARNRQSVNQAQTKMATDTARQMADLRAKGEFEKADALLALSQQYLSRLMELEQWSLEYGLSVAKFNESLRQWQAEYDMELADLTGIYNGAPTLKAQQLADQQAKQQQAQLADTAETLLEAGIMPSASQLSALGITSQQAQSYIAAVKLAKQSKKTGGSASGKTDSDSEKSAITMKISDAKAMAEAGIFTKPVLQAFWDAGYTKEYLMWHYGYQPPVSDINTTPIEMFGADYSTVWKQARALFDAGKTAGEIAAYLERFDDRQLSPTGRDYILRSLGLADEEEKA